MGDAEFITEEEAAKLLRVSQRSMQRWRHKEEGPNFPHIRAGRRVLYERSALIEWVRKQMVNSPS